MLDLSWLLLIALGLLVGGFGTLIGAGGGFLLVPLLLYLYPADSPATLTSISLGVVAMNALSGVSAYARAGRINYRTGLALSLASVPGTMAGAALTGFLHRGLFDVAFGAVLLLLAVFLFWRPSPQEALGEAARTGQVALAASPRGMGMGVAASAVVGWLSGVMGIGGSPLQVVVLTHLLRVPVRTGMPTAQFMVLLSALGGVGSHAVSGHFAPDLTRLVSLGIGALVGAQAGAAVSHRVTGDGLVRLLAVALSSVGLRLIFTAL